MNQTNQRRVLSAPTLLSVLTLGVGALSMTAQAGHSPTVLPPLFSVGVEDAQQQAPAPKVGAPTESESVAARQTTIREASEDPDGFLAALVSRYHGLDRYEDTARVVRITERSGSDPTRTETDIRCRIDEAGAVSVETAGAAARSAVGVSIPFRANPVLQEAYEQYVLWLAPHMALRDEDGPLVELSQHSEEPLRATRASAVMMDERDMVQLDLTSGDEDSPSSASRLSLFVDPVSMLVERVETQHRLPDGVVHSTTVDITPRLASTVVEEAACEEVEPILLPDPIEIRDGSDDVVESDDAAGPAELVQDEGTTLGVFDMFEAGVFSSRNADASTTEATDDVFEDVEDERQDDADLHREYTDGAHQHRVIF